MEVNEVKINSILNKSKLSDYCINPYLGCSHNCIYCYARFMCKYIGRDPKDWGKFVNIKINAPEVLESQIKKARGKIYMSSVCDPYLPEEEKYQITRKCLQILLTRKDKIKLSIQTKSNLIERDLDLLRQFKYVEIGFTVMCDDEWSSKLEPRASKPSERIELLKKFKEEGFRTYVFLGPIIPKITDTLDILEKTYKYSDYYFFDRLNLKSKVKQIMKPLLKEYKIELSDEFYEKEKEKIQKFCKSKNISHVFCY